MINIDFCTSINPFINELVDRGTVTEEDLYPMVDPYADTQVTDLFINTFGQYSNKPSYAIHAATLLLIRISSPSVMNGGSLFQWLLKIQR